AGELHPALADDSLVLQLELLGELVDVRDARNGAPFLFRGARFAVRDVFPNRTVEEEVVLHHGAELGAIIMEACVLEVVAIDENAPALRGRESHHEIYEST